MTIIPFESRLAFTTEEAAKHIGVPTKFIVKACREGKLKATKSLAGAKLRRWIITRENLEIFVKSA